jgi:hypothetical protein
VQSTPNPGVGLDPVLNGISCTSVDRCIAVGSYLNNSGVQVNLAEVWNGTTWSMRSVPEPIGTTFSALNSVSCTTASDCIAVGYDSTSPRSEGVYSTVALAEEWNGSIWNIQATPNPAGSLTDYLQGVSCTSVDSATTCIAVGAFLGIPGTFALAEFWNGTTWVVQTVPAGGSTDSQLNGVSCTAAESVPSCVAVGNSTTPTSGAYLLTLAEGWNGTSWSIQATPNPSGFEPSSWPNNGLRSVSCSAPTACIAVGSWTIGSEAETLAETWNGATWTIQSTPNPSGIDPVPGGVELNAVACLSADCVTVGYYLPLNDYEAPATMGELWNGSTWTILATTSPPGAVFSVLSGVSCVATACTAVGQAANTGTSATSRI